MVSLELDVKGMTCHACEQIVTEDLEDAGATGVSADYASGKVVIGNLGGVSEEQARKIVEDEGYEVLR